MKLPPPLTIVSVESLSFRYQLHFDNRESTIKMEDDRDKFKTPLGKISFSAREFEIIYDKINRNLIPKKYNELFNKKMTALTGCLINVGDPKKLVKSVKLYFYCGHQGDDDSSEKSEDENNQGKFRQN